jgi:hypothetical protein
MDYIVNFHFFWIANTILSIYKYKEQFEKIREECETVHNRMIYGISILVSLTIYLFFVIPLDFSQMPHHNTPIKIGILIGLVIFPLMNVRLFITKGIVPFLFSTTLHVVGLYFLFRGLYFETVMDHSFNERAGMFAGIEYFLLFILFSLLGIVVTLIIHTKNRTK